MRAADTARCFQPQLKENNMLSSRFIAVSFAGLFAASAFAADHGDHKSNIIEAAEGAGQFSTLLTAIEVAGLTETLATGGPFTVFAPTDAPFAALPEADLAPILADIDTLTAILTYHVVDGAVMSAQVIELDSATTLQG